MKGVRVNPRKTKGTAGLARAEDNKTIKTKKKIQGPGAAMGRASDDASYDDSDDPPYKPRDEDSSESELDDDDTGKAMVGRSSTTMSAKLMEKTKTELVKIVLYQRTQIIGLQERLEKEKISRNQSRKQARYYKIGQGRKRIMPTASPSSAEVSSFQNTSS
jgi:hypothetical protein